MQKVLFRSMELFKLNLFKMLSLETSQYNSIHCVTEAFNLVLRGEKICGIVSFP